MELLVTHPIKPPQQKHLPTASTSCPSGGRPGPSMPISTALPDRTHLEALILPLVLKLPKFLSMARNLRFAPTSSELGPRD